MGIHNFTRTPSAGKDQTLSGHSGDGSIGLGLDPGRLADLVKVFDALNSLCHESCVPRPKKFRFYFYLSVKCSSILNVFEGCKSEEVRDLS